MELPCQLGLPDVLAGVLEGVEQPPGSGVCPARSLDQHREPPGSDMREETVDLRLDLIDERDEHVRPRDPDPELGLAVALDVDAGGSRDKEPLGLEAVGDERCDRVRVRPRPPIEGLRVETRDDPPQRVMTLVKDLAGGRPQRPDVELAHLASPTQDRATRAGTVMVDRQRPARDLPRHTRPSPNQPAGGSASGITMT